MMITNVTPTINSKVDSSTNNISIHFSSPVFLSNGNIIIYKASDNNLRQSVSANSEYCTLSNDGKVAYIRIVNGTFSEHCEKYYVRVDSNFVKTRSFNNEALRGIESNVWLLESVDNANYSETAATISVALTVDASKRFLNSSLTNKPAYFDALLNELANKVPIKRKRLSSDEKFQNFGNDQIVISFRIGPPSNAENTAQQVHSNLNHMLKNNKINNFLSGATNDLDSTYGFKVVEDLWNQFKLPIIAAMAIFAIICLFSHILSYKLNSKKFEAINSAILRLGLIIPNFILSILFIVYYSKDRQELYLPSVLLFSVSLLINFCITTYTVYNGINDPVIVREFIRKRVLVTVLTILAVTDYEYLAILKNVPRFNEIEIDFKYLTIMKDDPESVKAKTDYEYLKISKDELKPDEIEQIKQINMFRQIFRLTIIYGALFDIFLRNIPQIVIQVRIHYYIHL
ncbi:hypothetical protein F8M41_005302 [Gigaspora margarita]|uniref:Uncharacterized protein n=1 Tax=Gigaspora margarita TaxID=4874 RepID=A0A8H4AXA4_GIGMA|nr:hypothetical protein F8M41_005302 [Gigaspora margarita]